MADTVTEFINVTGKTYTELQTGVTIVTNNSTDQAVVKDVVLTNPNSRTLQLAVGNAVVAQTVSAARLAGSELLGSSNTLLLKTGSAALFNRLRYFDSTSSAYNDLMTTLFSTDSVPSSITGTESALSFGSTFSVPPYFAVFAANGDFYYSNNSSSALYRRAGGVAGSQTTITSRGHSCSFDGRYIYSFNTTSGMAVTDTQNNGSVVQLDYTGVPAVGATGISAAIDGYVWLKPSYNEQAYLINPTTGVGVALGGYIDANSARSFVGIGKTSTGDYVAIQTTSTANSVYWWNFGPSLAAPSIKANGGIAQSLGANANINSNNILRTPGSNQFLLLIAGGGSTNTLFNVDTITAPTNFSLSGFTPSSSAGKILSVTGSTADIDFGTINVRATGIKTTP